MRIPKRILLRAQEHAQIYGEDRLIIYSDTGWWDLAANRKHVRKYRIQIQARISPDGMTRRKADGKGA